MEKKPVIALTSIAPSIAIWLYRAKDFSSRDGCLGKAADRRRRHIDHDSRNRPASVMRAR